MVFHMFMLVDIFLGTLGIPRPFDKRTGNFQGRSFEQRLQYPSVQFCKFSLKNCPWFIGESRNRKPSHIFLGRGWYTNRRKQRSKNLPLKAMLVVGRRDSPFFSRVFWSYARHLGYFSGRVLGCPWKVYTLFTGLTTYFYRGYNPWTKYQQDIPVSQ